MTDHELVLEPECRGLTRLHPSTRWRLEQRANFRALSRLAILTPAMVAKLGLVRKSWLGSLIEWPPAMLLGRATRYLPSKPHLKSWRRLHERDEQISPAHNLLAPTEQRTA